MIWISWERHRRTRELSRALGAELCEFTSDLGRLFKYPVLLLRSTLLVARRRPSVLVVQCPSVILAVWAGLVKRAFGFTLVADLHNEAVTPFIQSFPLYRWLLRWIHRRADLCLVSNAALKTVVEHAGGTALVLPDRLPQLKTGAKAPRSRIPSVVFVCTYAPDEPYVEVIEAARAFGPGIQLHVTGNFHNAGRPLDPPSSVRLTGFLSEEQYVGLLQAADVIVDLTSMEDCLVCGAYEAAALGKPLVTSDTAALRRYFTRGTVYTAHDVPSLVSAIRYAIEHRDRLASEMHILKQELSITWAQQMASVRTALGVEKAVVNQ